MAMNLLELAVKVSSSGTESVERDLSRVESAGARAEKSLGGSLKNVGGALQSAGKQMTTFVTLPMAGVGAGLVKLAGDAEAASTRMSVNFGDATKNMMGFLTTLQKTTPASMTELKNAASGAQGSLTTLGVETGKANKMTKEALEVASNLSAHMDIPMTEALDAVQAGYAGNTDSLRNMAYNINQTMIDEEALRLGLIKEGEAADGAARAQAVHSLVLKQSQGIMNAAERQSDTFNFQMRALWASIKDTGAEIGENLLPILTPLAERLAGLVRRVGEMGPGWQAAILAVGAFAAAIGPLLVVVGTLFTVMAPLVTFLGTVGLAGALGAAAAAVGTFLVAAAPFVAVALAIGAAALLVYRNWSRISPVLTKIGATIRSILAPAFNFLRSQVQIVMSFWNNNQKLMQRTTSVVWNRIRAIVTGVVRFLWNNLIRPILGIIVSFWKQNHTQIMNIVRLAWTSVKTIARAGLRILLQLFKLGMQLIVGDWRGAWQTIQNIGRIVWNAIQVIVRNALNILKNVIRIALNVIRGIWEAALRAIREWVQGFAQNIRSIFSSLADFAKQLWRTAWDGIRGTWENATSRIREWVSGWRDNLKNIFVDLRRGIWDAMKSIGRALWEPIEAGWNTAKQIWNTIVDAIAGILKKLGDPGGFGKKLEGAKFAEGGVREGSKMRNARRGGPVTGFAEGGIRNRGYATSATYLVGEDLAPGEREYILTESKKGRRAHRNGRLWEEYGRRNGLLPNREGRPRPVEGRGLDRIPRFSRGGRRSQAGEGLGGTHWDVYDFIKKRADELVGKHGGSWNTYSNHITTSPANENSTVDFWGPGGRGDPSGNPRGDAINRDVHTNYRNGLINTAWRESLFRPDGSSQSLSSLGAMSHWDHVHVAWSPDPNAKIVSGSGGDSGSSRVAAAWDKWIQPIFDRFLKPLNGDYVMRKMLHAAGKGLVDSIRTMVVGSDASGPGSNEGTVKDMIRRGLEMSNAFPPTQANIDEMYSRAMQESGGDTKAINDYDVNAQNGTPSKGLFQIIEPTWESHRAMYGADMGSFDENWGFGDKSASVAARYMKARYGEIVGATGVGYSEGGMAIGPQLVQLAEDAGKELVLPLDNARVVRSAQTALGTAELRQTLEREIGALRRDNREMAGQLNELVAALPEGIKDGVNHNLAKGKATRAAVRAGQEARKRVAEARGGW